MHRLELQQTYKSKFKDLFYRIKILESAPIILREDAAALIGVVYLIADVIVISDHAIKAEVCFLCRIKAGDTVNITDVFHSAFALKAVDHIIGAR